MSLVGLTACPDDPAAAGTDTDVDDAPMCGNGVIEAGEACDGTAIPVTCDALGFSGGALSCDVTCQIVATQCTACGDGSLDAGEGCDDANEAPGDGCSPACAPEAGYTCAGSPSVCTASCGDGMLDAGEVCDDGDMFGADGCSETCTVEPGWACAGQPSVCASQCGNGALDAGEECDGDDFSGVSCVNLGYLGGNLICTGNCVISPAACDSCGDDFADPGEACDGTDLDGGACIDLGFGGGELACDAECAFDISGCDPCGNGVIEGEEECDQGPFNSDTDADACRTNCTNPSCGDLVIDTGEGCDPPAAGTCDKDCTLPPPPCLNCGDLLAGAAGVGCCGSDDLYAALDLCVCGGFGSDCAIACADTLCAGLDPTGDDCATCLSGKVDCNPQYGTCNVDATTDVGAENTPAACGDACNNDGDIQTDCDDTDCFGVGVCMDAELNCTDGADNDVDLLTDCDDPDCTGDPGCPG